MSVERAEDFAYDQLVAEEQHQKALHDIRKFKGEFLKYVTANIDDVFFGLGVTESQIEDVSALASAESVGVLEESEPEKRVEGIPVLSATYLTPGFGSQISVGNQNGTIGIGEYHAGMEVLWNLEKENPLQLFVQRDFVPHLNFLFTQKMIERKRDIVEFTDFPITKGIGYIVHEGGQGFDIKATGRNKREVGLHDFSFIYIGHLTSAVVSEAMHIYACNLARYEPPQAVVPDIGGCGEVLN